MNSELRNQLRKTKILARNSLSSAERESFSLHISNRILDSDIFHQAKIIMIYRSVNGEVCLEELESKARQLGKKICYPRCISKSEMLALTPKSETNNGQEFWQTGSFGIQEPAPEHSIEIAPSDIDLIICPCTVFDENCRRMGMGAGYYDRYLTRCENAAVIAVAFEVQKTEKVPMEPWDRRMDMVFTEKQVYICRK